jgi:acyl-homoserine-lactone acylase
MDGSASFINVTGNGGTVVNKYKEYTMKLRKTPSGRHALSLTVALLGSTLLAGCFDSDNDSSSGSTPMSDPLMP